jgi:hypothetical protein
LLQVTGKEMNQRLPRHQAKNRINSLAPSVERFNHSYKKKKKINSRVVTGRTCLSSAEMDLKEMSL